MVTVIDSFAVPVSLATTPGLAYQDGVYYAIDSGLGDIVGFDQVSERSRVTMSPARIGTPRGLDINGLYFYAVKGSVLIVCEKSTGLEVDFKIGSSAELHYDGLNFWGVVVGLTQIIYADKEMNLLALLTAPNDDCYGICSDGTYLWVVSNPNGPTAYLHKLAFDGTVLEETDIGGSPHNISDPVAVCFDGVNLHILDSGGTIYIVER